MVFDKALRALTVLWFRMRLGRVGRNFRTGIGTVILEPRNVFVGDDVFFGPGTYISSPARVVIGDRVMFGPQVMLIGGDHDLASAGPLRFAPPPPPPPPIHIEDDAWIGARTIILKSVRIGRGAVVGAGSIVVRDIPESVIAAGNPCRVIRKR